MTDHAELRRVAALAHPDAEWFIARNLDHPNIDKPAASFIATATPKAVLALLDEIDRLKAENEVLRGALQAVVDDPTWRSNDNTLWPKIIKAMNPQGATSSP
ncbi:ead/Ea22-like family protein [Pseudomonas aeruginosa]|nr:ead/Ea22-like family protein [Pseudomonas aeruginosa]MBG4718097.1 ead/Ea22-like family protein [Pseudomonas aeruginosa]